LAVAKDAQGSGEGPVRAARPLLDDAWWPMFNTDPDGVVVTANQRFADLVGSSVEAVVGRSILDLLDPSSIGPEVEHARQLLAREVGLVRGHRRITLADRTTWEGEVLVSLLRDEHGEPQEFHFRLYDEVRQPPERIAWREAEFPLALDGMRVGVAIIGLDGVALQVNRALCELTGRTEDELRGLDLLSLAHPDDREADVELGTRAWLGEIDSYTIEKRLLRPDGEVVWVLQEVTFARDENGELLHLIGQVIDISDRKAVELELAGSRAELSDLIDQMPVGLLSADASGLIVQANRAAAAIAGLGEIPRGFNAATIIHPDDLPRLADEIRRLNALRRDYHVEFRLVRPDGSHRWIRNDARPSYLPDGSFAGARGTWLDITKLKEAEEELRRRADHDALTGLGNRRLVFDRLGVALARRLAGAFEPLTVLFVDLDGFKAVNDAHGHGVGDELLRVAAERLRMVVGSDAFVARFGGDEFLVCFEADRVGTVGEGDGSAAAGPGNGVEHAHARRTEELAAAIIEAMGEPFAIDGRRLSIGASVGIASWTPGATADDLVNAADRAVYDAKRSGRSCWRWA
jgi:PAS domain S-box-containing protein